MTASSEVIFVGRGIVRGIASGQAMVSESPISFLGDVDIRSGNVVGKMNDLCGRCLAGRILIVPSTRGSAGAWRFLYQLKQHGTHPAAIVSRDIPDPSVVQGAILSAIPIIATVQFDPLPLLSDGTPLRVDGTTGQVMLVRT